MTALKNIGRNDDLADGGDATEAAVHAVGAMGMWPGLTAPTGWLLCVGTLVPRTTYSRLFAKIGHAFNGGVDPGGAAFKLPDFRGRFAMGQDSSAGITFGARAGSMAHPHTAGTLLINSHAHGAGSLQMDAHSHGHTLYLPNHSHGLTIFSPNVYNPSVDSNISRAFNGATQGSGDLPLNGGIDAVGALGFSGTATGATAGVDGSTGDATSDATATFPYVPINYIIKT